jgi:hypothetical protein
MPGAERVYRKSGLSAATYAMRASYARFSIRLLMVIIAMCAALLALVVQAPFVAILIGPIVASAIELRKGGKGLVGGMIGGVITWVGLGLFFLTWKGLTHLAFNVTAEGAIWLMFVFAVYAVLGAVIGLAEGIAFYYARYLMTLPKLIRLRAERSARANRCGSTVTSHDDWDSSAC